MFRSLLRLLLLTSMCVVVACGPPAPVPASAASAPASSQGAEPAAATAENPHGRAPARHHAGRHHGEHESHSCGASNHRFDDPERWAKVFDDPARDAWQKPDDVVKELRLRDSDLVADLGAGTGYFAARLARAVPRGKVLAVDIEPKLVEHMRKRAEREGTLNVEAVLATAADPKLPRGVHVVLVVDTYHHIAERAEYFRRVRERLAPDGRVVIVDFKMGKLPVGPPDSHKLPRDVVTREMSAAGYVECASFDRLPYQYMLTYAVKC
jgi:SAM-dependent methyltransferase